MKIAVIILHYGQIKITKNCLQNLRAKINSHQVILINNTTDDLKDLAKIIPGTKLVTNTKNLGFGRGVNQGIELASKDPQITHFFLMNNDLSLSFGSFDQLLLAFAKNPSAGIVAPVLHHGTLYDWGGKYNRWAAMVKHKNWNNKPKTVLKVEHVAGAAMLISRKLIDKIGLFDERFFLYYEDLDFCLRAGSAGFTIHIVPEVVAIHEVSAGSTRVKRSLHQWRSHFQFVTKYLFKKSLPTAYLYNLIFYPLIITKSIFSKKS